MDAPRFLSLQNVIRIQENQLEEYGGIHGIRDMNLLESAVAAPMAGFGGEYLHEDIFAMAAAYLYHITQNHPFLDGNKRAGAMAAYVFLVANGYDLELDEEKFEDLCFGVAAGRVGKDEVAEFFRHAAKE